MQQCLDIYATVITVTYGDRWNYLEKLLVRIIDNPYIKNIIIVDNGSTYEIVDRLDTLCDRVHKISIVKNCDNLGSAAGFAAGINEAVNKTDSQFLWLLDDDNVPRSRSLESLLEAYSFLGSATENALVSLRQGRIEFDNAVKTGAAVFNRNNSFMGFHLADALVSKFKSYVHVVDTAALGQEVAMFYPLVPVGYAPYGGFFFHRKWVERIGLPNEQYFTYCDDHDYTSRLIAKGGRIFLCALSQIDDLETSWHVKKENIPPAFCSSVAAFRIYYGYRNRVYYEQQHNLVTNTAIYFLNMIVYLSSIAIKAAYCRVAPRFICRRLNIIAVAIRAGLAGNLGKASESKYISR